MHNAHICTDIFQEVYEENWRQKFEEHFDIVKKLRFVRLAFSNS